MLDKTFGKYAALAKFILALLGLGLIVFLVWYVYKKLEAAKIQSTIEGTTATANVNGTPVQVNIGTKAVEIYDALHGSAFYEDEVKAVNAVLSVPKPLIPQLSQTYYVISGNINLKTDLQEYLDNNQWLSIASQFN